MDAPRRDRWGAPRTRPTRRRAPTVHNNIGMTGDPADIGHAPVDILRMDVLNVFRRPCDVGQVSAGAVLTALWLRCHSYTSGTTGLRPASPLGRSADAETSATPRSC